MDLRAGLPENEEHYTDDYEYLSDSDLEDDSPEPKDAYDSEENTMGPEPGISDSTNYWPRYSELVHHGKVVVVKDAAFATSVTTSNSPLLIYSNIVPIDSKLSYTTCIQEILNLLLSSPRNASRNHIRSLAPMMIWPFLPNRYIGLRIR